MTTGLIAALGAAAKQAREDADVPLSAIAGVIDKTENTVKNWEDGRVFGAVDDLLRAYEETTGVSLFDLLDEARATLKTKGSPS